MVKKEASVLFQTELSSLRPLFHKPHQLKIKSNSFTGNLTDPEGMQFLTPASGPDSLSGVQKMCGLYLCIPLLMADPLFDNR